MTLSTRQQMRFCSIFYHGAFQTVDTIIDEDVKTKQDIIGGSEFEVFVINLMDEVDYVCKEVSYKCQTYKTGSIIILCSITPDELEVGLIKNIIVKPNDVIFVITKFKAFRSQLGFFKCVPVVDIQFLSITVKNIIDYKPLSNHGTPSEPYFCLHHHISCAF